MASVSLTVRLEGTCSDGHAVFHDLPVRVLQGSHGPAFATTDCPSTSCGKHVNLAGSYTT